jgi:integrase
VERSQFRRRAVDYPSRAHEGRESTRRAVERPSSGHSTALRSCFGSSDYLHPGRYDQDQPISNATLNRVTDAAVERIRQDDPDFQTFGVHDLRRTLSTGLNRAKFDERWNEMSLAHISRNKVAAIYNVNRYLSERKIMLQCWADMIDCWMRGESARDLIIDAKRRAAEVHEDDLDDDL